MANKTIFITEECEVVLKKKRKDNYEFNFSEFVQLALMQDNTKDMNIERIEEKIKDQKLRLNEAQENITYWEGIKREHKSEERATLKDLKAKANRVVELEEQLIKRTAEMKANKARRKNEQN